MLIQRFALPFALLALTASACTDDEGDGGGTGTDYVISLEAGGTPYETPTTGAIRNADGTFTFAAVFDETDNIGVSLTAPLAVGSHPTGAGNEVFITFNSADNSFRAGGTSGDGEFIVDAIEGDLVSGRFQADAISLDGTNEPISVTNGEFQVVITIKN